MKKIKVNIPIYDVKSGILDVKLSEDFGSTAKVSIERIDGPNS